MHDVNNTGVVEALPGYPWLPCPICHGTEGCDHSVPERARTAHPGLVLWKLFDGPHDHDHI